MSNDPSKAEKCSMPPSEPKVSLQGGRPEPQRVLRTGGRIPQSATLAGTEEARGGNEVARDAESPADLNREAANMMHLLTRQSMGATPLSIFSESAQVVLRQF